MKKESIAYLKKERYLTNKKLAKKLILEKIALFNNIYRFKFSGISIRDQKTRWGSCSSRGNLNFNYKIIFLPEKISDYIIFHELCHLKEFNHSKKFWDLVAREITDYKIIRRELRQKKIKDL